MLCSLYGPFTDPQFLPLMDTIGTQTGSWPHRLDERTDPGLIALIHHPVDPQTQPFVTTIFSLNSDEVQILDVLPAAVGYLAVFVAGGVTLHFASGRVDQGGSEVLLAPTNAAVTVTIDGPLRMIAAALSPLGWAALTGIDATNHVDRADSAQAVLGTEIAHLGTSLREAHAAAKFKPEQGAVLLQQFIAERLQPIDPKYRRLIGRVSAWLSSSLDPPLSELYKEAGYSARQLQRLVVRFFGCGPKQLARKYRAVRVAALLQSPDTSADKVDQLTDLFFDQSHMIRELQHFTGTTPGRLRALEGSVLTTVNNVRNFTEIKPNVAALPSD